ncbi:MAG TPA: amidase [Alphaproteobacteria bacterium]|nr:amidase [Alphaproteobacteria bacterium]
MAERDLPFWSIRQLGRAYRQGRLSPVEATRLCLERIERHDRDLNAFTTVLASAALRSARKAEHELRAGRDRGPLHGVPIALKDLIDIAGVANSYGSDPVFSETPDTDAELVRRLRQSGAVILGKTNLLEFAYGAVNPKVGQTNNPWNLTRTSGGSSGGSAAAVAAGLCYAAVGTDSGGSIRGPASYCGIAGLKPSYGLVPLDGVFPLSWSLDHGGPLARSCGDASRLLEALTKTDCTLRSRRLERLRLALVTQHVESPAIRPDVRGVFKKTCRTLEHAGARLTEVDISEFQLCNDALMMVLMPEASVIHAERYARNAAAYGPQTRLQIEQGFLVPAVTYVRGQQFRRRLARRLAEVLTEVDAIISPTVPWVAPDADPAIDQDEGSDEMLLLAPYNLSGLPALSVPCGLGNDDLPVGLQIVGRPNEDRFLLEIGAAIEALNLLPHLPAGSGLEGRRRPR